MPSRAERPLLLLGVFGFPIALVGFAAVYWADRRAYLSLLREDGPVEALTALAFAVTAGLCALLVRRARPRHGPRARVFVALGALSLLAALEEISWGQRILGFESPGFFLRHSRQQETNAHNVFQKYTTLKVKDIAPVVFVLYGVALPAAYARSARVRRWLRAAPFVVPPAPLAGGFLLGSLLMLDRPTGREEEIGELFLSVGILLTVAVQAVGDRVRLPPRLMARRHRTRWEIPR